MPAPSHARHKKLWSTLLILDALFVILFGGTLAVKLSQHRPVPPPLQAPHSIPAPAPVRKIPQPTKIAEPLVAPPPAAGQPLKSRWRTRAAKPAAAQPPAPRPEAARPQESAAQVTARNRRLVIEWKKAQETAEGKTSEPARDPKTRNRRLVIEWQKPQPAAPENASQPVAAAQPGLPRHSVPVEFKLEAPQAQNVQLAGAFIVRGGRRQMVQQGNGVWTLTLRLLPGIDYRYWFVVDGKKTLDPKSPKIVRRASVLSVP